VLDAAGGVDAIFAIVLDGQVMSHVERLWVDWHLKGQERPTVVSVTPSEKESR
jgi:hypothetical protein